MHGEWFFLLVIETPIELIMSFQHFRIGLSRERVRQVGLVSLEKLKHAARKKRLDAVLVKHWFLVYFTVDLLLSVYIKKGNLYLTFIFLMRNKYRYTNLSIYIEGLGPWVSVTIELKVTEYEDLAEWTSIFYVYYMIGERCQLHFLSQ